MSVLSDPSLQALVDRLQAESIGQEARTRDYFVERAKQGDFSRDRLDDHANRFLADKMVALDPIKAEFCHLLCRSLRATRVVEVGTSFGVSTLYLADAVRANGGGVVIGTEYEAAKASKARANFAAAGLAALIDLREGDLRETLKVIDGPVDAVPPPLSPLLRAHRRPRPRAADTHPPLRRRPRARGQGAMMTRWSLPILCALVCGSRAQAQVDWDGLPEGRWTEVSSNTISDVDPCPSQDCSYSAVEGQSGVINDWCGGAFASGYGELGGLIAWGGGHNGYFGSEVYVFDLATGQWKRVSEPYDDGSDSVAPQCNDDGIYPDGSACPTHTYDQVDYHPATNRFVILGGTPDPVCGGCVDDRAHLFDLTSNDWQLGARKDGPVYYGGTSAYDAKRDVFWLLSAYSRTFASYDPTADEWTDHGSPGGVEIDGAGVIDPDRDLYLFIDARGSGDMFAIPLDTPDADFVQLNVAGDVDIQTADKLGFDRDASSKRFVAWDDGADLYVLDPPAADWRSAAWRWTRVAPAGGSVVPERNMNGTYGRLRYAASVNAFVLVSSTKGPVWAYRMSSGTGTGPTPRPDAGVSDPDAGASAGASGRDAATSGQGGNTQPVPVPTTPDAATGTGGASGTTASRTDASPDGTSPSSGSDDGCGCRVVSSNEPLRPGLVALLAAVCAVCFLRASTRRRHRAASSRGVIPRPSPPLGRLRPGGDRCATPGR